MPGDNSPATKLSLSKFEDPELTVDGAPRATVAFDELRTLWLNTGTLCNVECVNCYIQSSPVNDRLVYLTADDARPFLNEASTMGAKEIGFTGGEPFMNPDILTLIEESLIRNLSVSILTNAMKPMMRSGIQTGLLRLRKQHEGRMSLRISLDHYAPERHDAERGSGSFAAAVDGLAWLVANDFIVSVASRSHLEETETQIRAGFEAFFKTHHIPIDAHAPNQLVVFPEMDETADIQEITQDCWSVLGKNPKTIMCASSRMIVKRKGAAAPVVMACTLIAYDTRFELGASLGKSLNPVRLNHPHCARFCVLGGASCSTK